MVARKTSKKKEKTVDLPPEGPRNADPITNAPGSHPIETGVGATLGGAAAGLAVGAAGGPVGAVIGGIVGGAVAGGLAGKGVGELIDPTTEDAWLRDYFGTTTHGDGATHEHYRDAYRYGMACAVRHNGRQFEDVESDLRTGWDAARVPSALGWEDARGAIRHAYDRRMLAEKGTVTAARDHTDDDRTATRPGSNVKG